jgi:hypothetical protein
MVATQQEFAHFLPPHKVTTMQDLDDAKQRKRANSLSGKTMKVTKDIVKKMQVTGNDKQKGNDKEAMV